MERSLAVGATGGSVSAIFLRLLSAALDSPAPSCDCDCGECPLCADIPSLVLQHLDLFSLFVGILVGLLIGPLLDLVQLIRQSWAVWLRSRLSQLAAEEKPLYRIV